MDDRAAPAVAPFEHDRRRVGVPREYRGLIARPAASSRLAEGAPLTVVRASAGAGKTTAVAAWARTLDHEVLWVDLSRPPAGRTLWASLADGLGRSAADRPAPVDARLTLRDLAHDPAHAHRDAARGRAPRLGAPGAGAGADPTDADTAEAAGSTAAGSTGGAPVEAVRAAFEARTAPLTVVLDHADDLDDDTAAELVDAVASAPAVRLVVLGRDPRGFHTPATALRVGPAVVDERDLALTIDDVHELVLRTSGVDASREVVRRIYAVSSGHVAVARAAAIELGAGADQRWEAVRHRIATLTSAAVLPEAALAHDLQLRRFVADTCLADVLDPGLAAELTDVPDVAGQLDRCVRLGLATRVGGPASRAVAYSGAARLVLRGRGAPCTTTERRALARRVAGWSVEHGHPLAALRAAIAADDLQLASDVVRDWQPELFAGAVPEVQMLLEGLATERLLRHPVLAFTLALIDNAHQERRQKAIELFAAVSTGRGARSAALSIPDQVTQRTIEGTSLRLLGRPEAGAGPARSAIAQLDALGPGDREALARGVATAYLHNGVTLLYAGDRKAARRAIDRAHEAEVDDTPTRLHALSMAAGIRAIDGDMDEAARGAALARGSRWAALPAPYPTTYLRVADALLALERGRPAEAREAFEQLRPEIPTNEHWGTIVHLEAMLDLFDRHPLDGAHRLAAERERQRTRSALGTGVADLLSRTEATLLLAAGAPGEALERLRGVRRETAALCIARARVELASGQELAAHGSLARASRLGLASTRERAEHAAITAAVALRQDTTDAPGAVAALLALLRASGLRTPLALLPPCDVAAIHDQLDGDRRRWYGELFDTPVTSVLGALDVVRLTEKEAVVLEWLAETSSAAEIANELFVSVPTVKSQIRSVYRKLGVTSREEALARAHLAVGPSARRPADRSRA